MPTTMKYSEKVLKKINDMIESGELPSVSHDNNFITIKYDRVYSEKKGKQSTKFCYKIKNEAKPLFANANKTHVIVNHEKDINYNEYHNILIPKEIVAVACGFKDYKELKALEKRLPLDEIDRIEFMLNSLVPISEEEFNKI